MDGLLGGARQHLANLSRLQSLHPAQLGSRERGPHRAVHTGEDLRDDVPAGARRQASGQLIDVDLVGGGQVVAAVRPLIAKPA